MIKFKLTKGWRQNHKASGGFDFYNKKLNKNIFINYAGGAGICNIDSGTWDKSIKIKKGEEFESIVKRLMNGVKYIEQQSAIDYLKQLVVFAKKNKYEHVSIKLLSDHIKVLKKFGHINWEK